MTLTFKNSKQLPLRFYTRRNMVGACAKTSQYGDFFP